MASVRLDIKDVDSIQRHQQQLPRDSPSLSAANKSLAYNQNANDTMMNPTPSQTTDDHHRDGFTLIELIIVLAIIGIMVSVAIPTIHAFIDRSRIASALGAGRTIQGALATYSMISNYDAYPARIDTYSELFQLVNEHGASLEKTAAEMGFTFRSYSGIDVDGDGTYERYTMSLKVSGVPMSRQGWCILIEPSGVAQCHPE